MPQRLEREPGLEILKIQEGFVFERTGHRAQGGKSRFINALKRGVRIVVKSYRLGGDYVKVYEIDRRTGRPSGTYYSLSKADFTKSNFSRAG